MATMINEPLSKATDPGGLLTCPAHGLGAAGKAVRPSGIAASGIHGTRRRVPAPPPAWIDPPALPCIDQEGSRR
jgi:hypothetical protein